MGGVSTILPVRLKLIEERVFKSTGIYTPPPNAKLIQFILVSGGGGGGGGGGGLAGGYGGGGGGGGGAGTLVMGYILITGTLSRIGVNVGSGGAGGAGGAPGADGSPGGNGGISYIDVEGKGIGTTWGGKGGGGGKAGTSTSGGAGGSGGGYDYLRSHAPIGRTPNAWTWIVNRSPFGGTISPTSGASGASGSADGGSGGAGGGILSDYGAPLGKTVIYILDGRSIGGAGGAGGVGTAGGNGGLPEGYGAGGGGGGGGAPGYAGGNGSNGAPGIVILRVYEVIGEIIPGQDIVGW